MTRRVLEGLMVAGLAVALLLGGCSDDDETTQPGNGEEQMTAEQLMQEIEDVSAQASTGLTECQAGELLDPLANEDMLDYLERQMLPDMLLGTPLSAFYGTWDDTSASRDDGQGIARIAATPTDAVRLLLVATDSLGAPLEGHLTLNELDVEGDTLAGTFAMTFDAALLETTTGDEAAFTLTMNAEGEAVAGSGLEAASLEMTSAGQMCAVAYSLTISVEEGAISLSGFYEDEVRVAYEVGLTMAGGDTLLTASIAVGSGAVPLVRVEIEAQPSDTDCVTGAVIIRGRQQAEIVATGCGTEEVQVYVVVDGEMLPAEEVFEELWAALEDLLGGLEVAAAGPLALSMPPGSRAR